MNWIDILPLLPQVGIVILFMWYQERSDKRHADNAAAREDKRLQATKENHSEWREFLREQQALNNSALARIAEEVKRNTENIASLSVTLIAHDTRTGAAIEDVKRIRERLAQAKVGNIEESPLPPGRK